MTVLRLMLSGYGRVGREFVKLLHQKQEGLFSQYGVCLRLSALTDVDGAAVGRSGDGLPLDRVLAGIPPDKGPASLVDYGDPQATTASLVKEGGADVLVEATPTDIQTGEPGLTNITAALENGLHVVTATKGPLVLKYGSLVDLARRRRVGLKFGAATAAALPAVDIGAYCLAGAEILRIEGILNGTTNYILTQMRTSGQSYLEALAEAQCRGITETDPRLDVDGWDAAIKLVLIANALMGCQLTLDQVQVSGITAITPEEVLTARAAGKAPRLIAEAVMQEGTVRASVGIRHLGPDHPLAHVDGPEKGITYFTDSMDRVTVTGGRSDPRGAAAALLKDILNLGSRRL